MGIIQGDCLEELRKLADASVDSLVTDPPYGLSSAPDIAEVMRHWISGEEYKHTGYGFMQKSWDSFVPGPNYWAEVFRVMKPGAHGLVFAGTRTWDLMGISLRFAGFEIRDCIQWLYGSGFPKSLSIDKAIDKAAGAEREVVGPDPNQAGRKKNTGIVAGQALYDSDEPRVANITRPSTDAAKQWQGFGTALKPAWEPVILIRKPCSEKTVAANVCKHGTGALNIDGCRISTVENRDRPPRTPNEIYGGGNGTNLTASISNPQGRFPANLVLSHSPECVEVGVKDVGSGTAKPARLSRSIEAQNSWKNVSTGAGIAPDNYGTETVPDFRCAPGCAVAELDKQSVGTRASKPSASGRSTSNAGSALTGMGGVDTNPSYSDSGGASRFFATFKYCPKVSPSERNAGCEGFETKQTTGGGGLTNVGDKFGSIKAPAKNHHPTVKPLKLMRYLIRLITPPGGLVLDPFAGSGSTGVAAIQEGFNFIGIEREAEYVEIANARLAHTSQTKQEELFK